MPLKILIAMLALMLVGFAWLSIRDNSISARGPGPAVPPNEPGENPRSTALDQLPTPRIERPIEPAGEDRAGNVVEAATDARADFNWPSSNGVRATFRGDECTITWEGSTRIISYDSGERFSEGVFVEGFREGAHRGWFRSGQVRSSGNYLRGKREGDWLVFHDNGQLLAERAYANGDKEGPSHTYFEDGSPMTIGFYKSNKEEGDWTFWVSPGVLDETRSGVYRDGHIVSDAR